MTFPSVLLLSFLAMFITIDAQMGVKQQLLSTFIYTLHGDRTPLVLSTSPTLTPLGAQQLYEAGNRVRQTYVTPNANGSITIHGISPYQLEYDQLTVLSTSDQYVFASAQAFLQGLYPPLQTSSNYTYIDGQSTVQNGTNLVAPLQGYQYPNIMTLSTNDLNSIWLSGWKNCPAYSSSSNDYYETESFQSLQNRSQEFYTSLQPDFLKGIFPNASVGYLNAYNIYDYLNYAYVHNTSAADLLTPAMLTEARTLADDLVFALNADTTASGSTAGDHIRAIAGRTLATRIMQAFYTTINTQGASDKMTLAFGSYEPMVAFAALARLVSPLNSAFYNVPASGSSFILELISMQSGNTDAYPETSDMFIRFLYQNGTDDDSSPVAYPLFGLSPSQTLISFTDFVAGLQEFEIFNVEDWCKTCSSFSVFCPAFVGTNGSLDSAGQVPSHQKGLSPAVAGVVGAIVTLAVAALLLGTAMLFGGMRFHRVHTKRMSELGGFKGAKKLASDQDLTIPKGNVGAVVVTSEEPTIIRGHERVGSWELKDQAKAEEAQGRIISAGTPQLPRPSYEGDDEDMPVGPDTVPVHPRSHI
ncbi:hypothetical protein A1O1_02753 [Capronia coronata CBS 617.96]|uniref:Acid phosphatase n=1 Tax=Capronia coronata CBS 617.96 TaxID=1182541 RepID=W9ZIR2_9EURO|nr:uncharacterized protein A1O1_02753 [Capronia coronata CBS 617.96]EXJ94359.1 hypothetical protein A1O1_02753 [Capronia coronata CBS 617.96]